MRNSMKNLFALPVTAAALLFSGSAISASFVCSTDVTFLNVDATTQSIEATGSGMDATYGGDNPVIIAILTEQSVNANFVTNYVVEGNSCFDGAIVAVDL